MDNLLIPCAACKGTFPFKKRAPHKKYCSDACRQRAHQAQKKKQPIVEMCAWCGKGAIKVTDPHDGFCSGACKRQGESYAASGGRCHRCGYLWLGQKYCRKCGAQQNVGVL